MDIKRQNYIKQFDQKKFQIITEYIKEKQNNNNIVLDIGCGYGKYSKFYAGNAKYIGVNIDTNELHIARKTNAKYGYNFIKADANNISFIKNETIDMILLIYVIEHINNPASLFSNISRILKKNGIVIIWTPNIYSIGGFLISIIPNSLKFFIKRNLTKTSEQYPTYYKANSIKKLLYYASMNNLSLDRLITHSEIGYLYKYPGFYHLNNLFVKIFKLKQLEKFRSAILISFRKKNIG